MDMTLLLLSRRSTSTRPWAHAIRGARAQEVRFEELLQNCLESKKSAHGASVIALLRKRE